MSEIAVVIPARNAAATLAEALRSVLAAPEVGEVIVVDDGSTDGTADVARIVGDRRVTIVEGPRSGVAGALNTGFSAVTCPFVARCDADDFIPVDRLAWQLAWLRNQEAFVAVSGGFASVFPDGHLAAELACDGAPRDVTELLRNGETVTSLCAWLMRTEAIRKVGGARDWFASAEDIDLQFRLAALGRVWHIPRVSYFYRLHDSSITHSTSTALITFYDAQARLFARQRQDEGCDALDRGVPPPRPDQDDTTPLSPSEQAIGHVIGQAWRDLEAGRPGPARRRLHGLAIRHPLSLPLWRALVMLNAKALRRFVLGTVSKVPRR